MMAGQIVTRQNLDQALSQTALALMSALTQGSALAGWLETQTDAQVTSLDSTSPYTADELAAIRLWQKSVQQAVDAAQTGEPWSPAMTTALAVQAQQFTGLALANG